MTKEDMIYKILATLREVRKELASQKPFNQSLFEEVDELYTELIKELAKVDKRNEARRHQGYKGKKATSKS